MLYNHQLCYWLLVTMLLCLITLVSKCTTQDRNTNNDDIKDGSKEDRGSYLETFASVAGKVASSAGDTIYSAATSGASTIGNMFNDEDDKRTCDADGCVENDYSKTSVENDYSKTGVERTDGIFHTVTNTVSNAWSSTKEATGAALDGVRSGIAAEVDSILGAIGNRIATALTPEYLITKGLSFLPSQLVSAIVFLLSLIIAYIIASFISVFTAIAFLMAIYLIHSLTGPLWVTSMMLMGLDYTLWTLKFLVFYPRISAVVIGLILITSIYCCYIRPCLEKHRRWRKIDNMDDNVRMLMDAVDDVHKQQRQILKMVQELHDKQMKK